MANLEYRVTSWVLNDVLYYNCACAMHLSNHVEGTNTESQVWYQLQMVCGNSDNVGSQL